MKVPLLLLPGLLCDGALWAHPVQHLADVAQPRVMDITRHDSVALLARSVLDDAPPRFALAALSMGGYVAMEILRQDPSRVLTLALLNTTARPDTPEAGARRKALITLARTGKFKGVTPRLMPSLVHPHRLQDHALTDTVLKMAERVGRDAFVRQQTAILSRPDSRPTLAKVTVPTLVLTGRQDALTPPEHAGEMARLLPHATLTVVEDCGHLSPLEQPPAITALLRLWLNRLG